MVYCGLYSYRQRVHFSLQARVGVFSCQQILAKIFVIFDILIKNKSNVV